MDSTAHGEVILTAITGGRGSVKALRYAGTVLTPEHFENQRQRDLYVLLTRYAAKTGGIMTRHGLEDLLRSRPPGSRSLLGETYDAIARRPLPAQHEFYHSVDQLREQAADRDTGAVFATGMEILRTAEGVRDERGQVFMGHEDARAHVLAELARIDRDLHLTESPEGDAREEAGAVLAAYAKAKDLRLRGEAPGIRFGLPKLDAYMDGGLGPGEMAVLLAWTTAGKTRFCIHMAWDACVMQGKHVVFFTTETRKRQIDTYLVSRHSRLPQFGLERGLNSRAIRAGRLSPGEEAALDAVAADWQKGDYGRLRVVQMPEHCTVSGMAARYAAISQSFTPDLVVADYLQLFLPERTGRRDGSDREDQSGILKSAGRWCGAANKGNGVAFISPWQTNKAGRQSMRASGGYQLEDASDTSEAAKTPDVVLSLADPEEDTTEGRATPLQATLLKNRDGPKGRRFYLTADYATSLFEDREEAVAPDLDMAMAG
jgi:replicative DNA helicase